MIYPVNIQADDGIALKQGYAAAKVLFKRIVKKSVNSVRYLFYCLCTSKNIAVKKNINHADNNASDLLCSAENRLQEELKNRSDLSSSSRDAVLLFQELLLLCRELEAQRKKLCQSRERTKKSLKRYSDLYTYAPLCYLSLAPNGRILKANRFAAKMFALRRSFLIGERFDRFIVPADTPVYNTLMERACKSRKHEYGEISLLGGDALPSRHRKFCLDVMVADDGKEYLMILSDVTYKKKVIQDSLTVLTERDAHHVNVINMIRNGYIFARVVYENEKATDFVHEEVNPGYEKITGLKNVIGKKITEVFPDVRRTQPEFIDKHLRVSETGDSDRFTIYLEPLHKWFDISVYSQKKGFFFALIDDITDTKNAEINLKISEQRFRNMFQEHSAIMLLINPDSGFIIEANSAATRFYGWSIEELRTMRIEEIISRTPEEIKFFLEKRWTEDNNQPLYRHRRADKSLRDVEVYSSTMVIAGETLRYTVVHDITERLRHEIATAFYISLLEVIDTSTIKQLLQMSIDKAELLTDSSIGFFHFVDDDQSMLTLQQWSTNTLNVMCKVKGDDNHYRVDEAGVWADALRERRVIIHNDFASLPSRKGLSEGHATVIREVIIPIFRHEKIVAILGVGNKLVNYDEDDVRLLTIVADAAWEVAAKKIGEEERITLLAQQCLVEQLAMHDSLTGLPNRRLLSERIALSLAQCRRNKSMAALMMFDLDKFKPVNDTFGHAVGDIVLQQVATRTLEILHRSSDSIARLGGDEFVLLMPQIDAISNAVAIAEKILNKIREPFIIEGHTINISCSIGIAVFPDHGENELTLMRHADDAMYSAKKQGRDNVKVFEALAIP